MYSFFPLVKKWFHSKASVHFVMLLCVIFNLIIGIEQMMGISFDGLPQC